MRLYPSGCSYPIGSKNTEPLWLEPEKHREQIIAGLEKNVNFTHAQNLYPSHWITAAKRAKKRITKTEFQIREIMKEFNKWQQ